MYLYITHSQFIIHIMCIVDTCSFFYYYREMVKLRILSIKNSWALAFISIHYSLLLWLLLFGLFSPILVLLLPETKPNYTQIELYTVHEPCFEVCLFIYHILYHRIDNNGLKFESQPSSNVSTPPWKTIIVLFEPLPSSFCYNYRNIEKSKKVFFFRVMNSTECNIKMSNFCITKRWKDLNNEEQTANSARVLKYVYSQIFYRNQIKCENIIVKWCKRDTTSPIWS